MIKTVVTRGFGNGAFNGTIALVVTRGYAIGNVINGPFFIKSSQAFMAGSKAAQDFSGGSKASQNA